MKIKLINILRLLRIIDWRMLFQSNVWRQRQKTCDSWSLCLKPDLIGAAAHWLDRWSVIWRSCIQATVTVDNALNEWMNEWTLHSQAHFFSNSEGNRQNVERSARPLVHVHLYKSSFGGRFCLPSARPHTRLFHLFWGMEWECWRECGCDTVQKHLTAHPYLAISHWQCWKMGGASAFKKGGQHGNTRNLHSSVWPAGTAKSGCKKTKKEWLSTRKRALHVHR